MKLPNPMNIAYIYIYIYIVWEIHKPLVWDYGYCGDLGTPSDYVAGLGFRIEGLHV